MKNASYYLVNVITFYRALAAPAILIFIIRGDYDIFKWLLVISFFTDAIDGSLARLFKVSTIMGAKLDSIADDLTIVAAIVGMLVFKREFVSSQLIIISSLLFLYAMQTILALIRYGKISSFHTYLAKTAAVLQGLSILQIFFFREPHLVLFNVAAVITALELLEEILIVFVSPEWQANVKGLYWVLKKEKGNIS